MPGTLKLYDSSAYDTCFTAKVLSCEEKRKEQGSVYQVVLDRTLFFPEEGGQSPDKGTLERAQVLDVQLVQKKCGINSRPKEEEPEDVIVHTLDMPLPVGKTVQGEIDWRHRFSNMQQHTGEHIFSGIVHRRFGYRNVGFHLSDSVVTMDYDHVLTPEQIAEIEWEANRVIVSDLPVQVTFPTPEEEKDLSYRSKIEVQGRLRIVTIPGCDVCACCAPHVRRTGEVGMLKVMQAQNYKGGVRLSILCGFRALAAFREKTKLVSGLTRMFSAGQDQLLEHLERLKSREQELEVQLLRMKQERLLADLEKIPVEEEHVLLFLPETEEPVLRQGINFLTERHSGICGIFWEKEPEKEAPEDAPRNYRFIIGSNGTDCRKAAELLRKELAARGGGSAKMVQGSVCARIRDIRKILTEGLMDGHFFCLPA